MMLSNAPLAQALMALFILAAASPASAQQALTPERAAKGKAVYEKRCAGCHGLTGQGDGPAADRLRPRPRDFKTSFYKFGDTVFGKLPLDAAIFRAVAEGLPGSSMPGWKDVLREEEIWDVVAYIKEFSRKFARLKERGEKLEPLEIGTAPKLTEADVQEGKELFLKNCEKCHGKAGRGSGPSAVALKHDLGDRIWPRNLTKGWTYRNGNSIENIYRTAAGGITGTPMPSHLESLQPAQVWKIAGYVDTIVQRERPKTSEVIIGKPIEGAPPTGPDDARWADAPATLIPLVGQIIEGERWFTPTLDSVQVRALYDSKMIYLLAEWDDPSASPLAEPNDKFPVNEPDAFAIQLPVAIPAGMEKPYFLGGGGKSPVILWKWTNGGAVGTLSSKGILKAEPIAGPAASALSASATYMDGQWRAVFTRPLAGGGEGGLTIETGKYIPIAFSAWDGNNGEKAEQRAISIWYWLLLEPPTPLTVYLWPAIIGLLIAGGEFWLVRKSNQHAHKKE